MTCILRNLIITTTGHGLNHVETAKRRNHFFLEIRVLHFTMLWYLKDTGHATVKVLKVPPEHAHDT